MLGNIGICVGGYITCWGTLIYSVEVILHGGEHWYMCWRSYYKVGNIGICVGVILYGGEHWYILWRLHGVVPPPPPL